jgi:hypothetical protein
MEETKFSIERNPNGGWGVFRLHVPSGQWIFQDARLTHGGARRYARKHSGNRSYLVRTVITGDRTTELTYRRTHG